MGDSVMNKDYPEQKQRAAVCYSQWKRAKKKAKGSEAIYWSEEWVDEALKDKGIFRLEIQARMVAQCDNCKSSMSLKKPKAGEEASEHEQVGIQACLSSGANGETKDFHFCDEECLRQFLNKRNKSSK